MKRILAMVISVALVATMAITGSIAYLQDTDGQANVMTLGKVEIDQHEYQRVLNEDGTYKTGTVDDRTSYILENFEQDKPLYPAVIPNGGTVGGVKWDYDTIPVRMSQVNSHGGAQVFNTPNAQDKFITVENTGKSDAYVRTLIALEVGTATLVDDVNFPNQPLINAEIRAQAAEKNTNGEFPWTFGYNDYVEIDGNKYWVRELIYTGAMTSTGWKHEGGILPKGETTYPNLCQVYMASRATNEDCEALDGNKNGTYDILVLSQAVQSMGFEAQGAEFALDEAFGDVTAAKVQEWFGDIKIPDTWSGEADEELETDTENAYVISTAEELAGFAALVNGGNNFKGKTVKLAADINLNNVEWTPIGNSSNKFQGAFDGQGHTISNLKISGNKNDVGLFGFTTEGEIKNVEVKNATVSGRLDVGVVAGTPYTSKYTNIKVTGTVKVDGFSYVGAVGGKNAYANWTDITVDVDEGSYVKANSIENGTAYRTYVGGVVGFMGEGGHTFTNVTSNIDVYGSTCDVGGIVGIAHYGNSFINCSSSGDVTIDPGDTDTTDAENAEIGGIAGVWHNGGSNVTFEGCSYTGKLSLPSWMTGSLNETAPIVNTSYSPTGSGNLVIK